MLIGLFISLSSEGIDNIPKVIGGEYLTSLTGVKVLYIYNSRYDTPDRLRTLGATVYEVPVSSIGSITADSLCSYDFVLVDIGAVSSLGFLGPSLQTYVSMGGGYWINQPNQVGSVPTLPPGFDVYVSSIWYGCGNSSCQTPTAAYSTHPITSGMPLDWTSGDYDTESSWGASWTVLITDVGPTLMTGNYGLGRLVYTDHCFSSTCIDPGTDGYIDRIGNWLAEGPCGPLNASDDLSIGENKNDANDIRVFGNKVVFPKSTNYTVFSLNGEVLNRGFGNEVVVKGKGVKFVKSSYGIVRVVVR